MSRYEKKFLKGVGWVQLKQFDQSSPTLSPILEINEVEITRELTTTEVTGGDSRYPLDSFINAENSTIRITNARIVGQNFELFGATKTAGGSADIPEKESITTGGAAGQNLTYNYKSNTVFAFDKDTGQSLTVTELGGDAISIGGTVPDEIDVLYERTVSSDDLVTYDFKTDDQPLFFEVIHKSDHPEDNVWQHIRIYKVKFEGSFTIVSSSEDQYFIPEINGKVHDPQRPDDKVMQVVMYPKDVS